MTLSDAQKAIDNLVEQGHLERTGADELNAMVKALYERAEYQELTAGAVRFAEREMLFEGKIVRPDLVLVHADKAVVIDYKTGSESEEEYVAQVSEYMRAVADTTGKPTQGYLVYLAPMRWVEVRLQRDVSAQGSLFD